MLLRYATGALVALVITGEQEDRETIVVVPPVLLPSC
jgi:hypothetical protein